MLIRIDETNAAQYDLLVQKYEEEFAPLTGKEKDARGNYPLDSSWREPYKVISGL